MITCCGYAHVLPGEQPARHGAPRAGEQEATPGAALPSSAPPACCAAACLAIASSVTCWQELENDDAQMRRMRQELSMLRAKQQEAAKDDASEDKSDQLRDQVDADFLLTFLLKACVAGVSFDP